jgi:acyl-CoA thioester hydrolase
VALRDDFRLVATMQARFRDTDGMGHVNNAVYLTYLEEARAAWFREAVGLRSYREVSIILARTCCDFRSPLLAGETLELGVRVASIGGKSFRMAYRAVERASGRLVLEAESVQVWYDYAAGRPEPVPDAFREKASAFEGRPL